MSDTNLFAQQRSNRRRSAVLIVAFLLFFGWIGFGGDYALSLITADAVPGAYRHAFPWIGFVAVLVGSGLTWHGWRNGPREVLWATGAWEVVHPTKPAEQVLVNVVEEMAIASGIPRPSVWIVPDPDPNAFATGTDERKAHIAVTEGLLAALSREELQGVIAHEIAHIRNYDVRLMTLLAALVGVMALLSEGLVRGGRHGRIRVRSSGSDKKGGLGALLLVIWLVSVVLAPVVSRLLALAVSRKREYLADASAAQFTRNPGALASALRRIEDAPHATKAIRRGSAHLCIADPLGRRVSSREGWLADILGTHPPMATRIARLKAMAYQLEKTGTLPGAA
ncbi:MAG TPA: M48 family metallopeptidase [Gemmatimonadales bacterium]|nr:M48 family metallopeptidase [Gemmatimonadales bacterium]